MSGIVFNNWEDNSNCNEGSCSKEKHESVDDCGPSLVSLSDNSIGPAGKEPEDNRESNGGSKDRTIDANSMGSVSVLIFNTPNQREDTNKSEDGGAEEDHE